MPAIRLTDALGLDLDGKLSSDANLLKLLPSFPRLADLTLDQVPVSDASAALNLDEPLPVAADDIALKVSAGAAGSFALLGPRQHALDEDDPFGEIEIQNDEIYLALALKFSSGGERSGTAGAFSFGFSAERDLAIHCYRRFQRGAAGFPVFRKALAAAASCFILPKGEDDLDRLQPNTVVVLRGTGVLAISAGASVSLVAEPLASVSLVGDTKFQAKAGATVGVDTRLTITGGYQVRLRRIEGPRTELGLYTMKTREAELSVSADIGVAATVGSFDLAERAIGALSPQPAVDIEEFKSALPGEDDAAKAKRLEAFQASIQAGVSTKLEASVKIALARLQSNEAAWRFEIDRDRAVTPGARAAITAAFAGDFGSLRHDPRALPAGFTQICNVLTDTDVHKLTLKLNLLGLVNRISVGKLAQVTSLERNANGDVTLITDSSSASRLNALLAVFGGDRKRLRKLLSEDFLIEAAYRVNDLGVLPPEFKARHTYFEIHDSTSRQEMRDNLDVPRIFGLIEPAEVARRLGDKREFGRTELYAETRYTAQGVRDAFLMPQGMPPSQDRYEEMGRSALGALLMDDENPEFRKLVATDDGVWGKLKQVGNRAKFAPIFGRPAGALDPHVEAAGADFSAITSWAAAMTAGGSALQEIDELLGGGSVAADEPRLAQAREVLKSRLADVVKNTREEFGDPLGMVMFYIAANQNAERTVILTGERVQRLELSA